MNEELTAASLTAGSLLSKFRFVIPPFQREYAWTQEEVSEFFRDLQQSLHRDFYFLGLVVLTGTGKVREVVDGQQRVLTLSLLAAALRDEASEKGRRATASQLSATFLSAIDYGSDEQVPRVKLASVRDSDAFRQLVDYAMGPQDVVESSTADGQDISSLLTSSNAYLRKQLRSDLSSAPDELKRIGEWANFLTNSIQFALFDHPDPASAYRVFEVMNTRGRGLTPTDLLKSYVLGAVGEDERNIVYDRWVAIIDRFRAVEQPNQVNQFIRHVVTVSTGYVAPRDLYDAVTDRFRGREGALRFLDTLERDLDVYLQMMDPSSAGPASEQELLVFESLNRLGVIVVRPVLLAIHHLKVDTAAAVDAVLRLVVLRMATGYLGTGAVERRISGAANRIVEEREWRTSLETLQDLVPDAEVFEQQAAARQLNKRVLHYLSLSVEQESRTPSSDLFEHLHPIRPRYAPDWEGFPDEDFTRWGSTLGNAVLASQERRPRGTNSWEDFKTFFLPVVAPRQAQELDQMDRWSTQDVQARGRWLAQIATRVWYGP